MTAVTHPVVRLAPSGRRVPLQPLHSPVFQPWRPCRLLPSSSPLHLTLHLLLLVLFLAAAPETAPAQQLARVLDPDNPVVTETANSGGACWVDLDGDGDLDLFVANGNLEDQPNSLFLNTGSGFQAVRTGPVVTDGGSSIGGTFGDFDEDGHLDLFVTNRNNFGNFLYRGEGDTVFTKVVGLPPVTDVSNSNSSSWVDADVDGDLDLYVVNFNARDFFYINDGGPGFTLASLDTLTMLGAAEPSIPGAWGDHDLDRRPDLFIGWGASGNDLLWRNEGNLAFSSSAFSDGRATLGSSWGDYDNDGDLDLVAMNFLNQESILYRNTGAPDFDLLADESSVVSNTPANAVGSAWGDYDNDGDLDLFVGAHNQNNLLYENQGPPNYSFTRVLTGPAVTDGGASFGCVWGDYDADGDLDLFVANQNNQANFLYRNEGNANHWIVVRCTGTVSNRSAIGARVHVRATIDGAPRWQMREVAAQSGYNSQNLDLHFGLGDATLVDSIRVEWPAGGDDVLVDMPANQLLRIVESSPADLEPSAPDQGDKHGAGIEMTPLGAGRPLGVRLTLARAGHARISLFDAGGRQLATLAEGAFEAGTHEVRVGPSSPPSGVYYCRVTHFDGTQVSSRAVRLVHVR